MFLVRIFAMILSILFAIMISLRSFLSIVVPEVGTNFVLNPSAETTGNFTGHNGATVTRETFAARFGSYSYLYAVTGPNQGINLTLSALANAVHHVTVYLQRGTTFSTMQASLDGGTTYNALIAIGPIGVNEWGRYEVTIPASQANGSTSLILRDTVQENMRVDAVQVEATSGYFTTYIDGDLEPSFSGAYRWSGLKHASTSTRSVQERNGGRERDLSDAYGVELVKNNYGGIGMPPVTLNMQPLALQAGAVHQSTKLGIRNVNYQLDLEGTSYANLHQKRQDLIAVVEPHAVRGDQAFTMGFKGANSARTAYGRYRYNGGLGFTQPTTFTEQVFLSMIAVDSDYSEDDRQTQVLDFQDTDTDADEAMARIDGAWTALGTGFTNDVHVIAYDAERGRVYFGGEFVNANSVVVNRITYWNGTTFVAMGSGVSGGGATVIAIKIAPNGDVWVGGSFTTAGGSAADGLARWDISAGSWVQYTNGAPGDNILAIEIDSTGRVYIGGAFSNWDGVANADNIAQSTDDGSTWTALSTGVDDAVWAFAVDANDDIYIGGDFTTAGAISANRIARWNGTAYIDMANGVDARVRALAIGKDGTLYVGGSFSTDFNFIAAWDGSTFSDLGIGVDNDVYSLYIMNSGIVLVGGVFTTAGGIDIIDRFAGWNGASWFRWDLDMPSNPTVNAVFATENDDIYIGYDSIGTATIAGRTTVTNGGTAKVSPTITILGPTTANVTATLQWIENQSTGARLYFNMPINTDEVITIDTRSGSVGIFSNFRGEITDNPLPPGGLSLFDLLPGANTIAAFMTGTTTGAEVIMHWDVKHLSVDGVA